MLLCQLANRRQAVGWLTHQQLARERLHDVRHRACAVAFAILEHETIIAAYGSTTTTSTPISRMSASSSGSTPGEVTILLTADRGATLTSASRPNFE